jgi:DNA-binding NarL/FixJ family response regulator
MQPGLTERECQIVRLVIEGKPNKVIAYELHLTEGTVKEYVSRILRKLQMGNRVELAVWAAQALR